MVLDPLCYASIIQVRPDLLESKDMQATQDATVSQVCVEPEERREMILKSESPQRSIEVK